MTVRLWTPDDSEALAEMIQDCLLVNHAAGADMLPTPKNANALLVMGLQAAARGEPCLFAALDSGEPMGYTEWLDLGNPLGLDYSGRILYGLGTYVKPRFRQMKLSHQLRDQAEMMAADLGFKKVVGVAYHDVGLQSALARGFRVTGFHVEKETV
jgi:acetyltransferase (GNAT) family protein